MSPQIMTDFSSFGVAPPSAPLTEYNIQKFQFEDLERSIRERESRMNRLIDEFARGVVQDLLMRMSDTSSATSQRLCSSGNNHNHNVDSGDSTRSGSSNCDFSVLRGEAEHNRYKTKAPCSSHRELDVSAPTKRRHRRKKNNNRNVHGIKRTLNKAQ